MSTASSSDVDLAAAAALAGADVVRRYYGGPLTRVAKSDVDFATEADVEAERTIRAVIAHERPGDAFLGEEDGLLGPSDATRRWLVDPLCGTLNFAAQTPLVGVNVALREGDVVTAAAVADPFSGELFRTDRPGAPSPVSRLVDVDIEGDPVWAGRLVSHPSFTPRFATRSVSSSLAVVWVSVGRRAGYVQSNAVRDSVHFAAPLALCAAAGCVATDLGGGSTGRGLVVACDAETHEALVRAVASSR